VIPEEVEKRRSLFWELLYLDARLVRFICYGNELFLTLGDHSLFPLDARHRFVSATWTANDHHTSLTTAVTQPKAYTTVRLVCICSALALIISSTDQEWKHSCYLECLAPVLDLVSGPSIQYDKVLDLDKKIRDFSFPQPLRSGALQSRALIMQKASLSTALEAGTSLRHSHLLFMYEMLIPFMAVLLQLHRTFFTRALSGPEEAFNRRHKYAPSVVAVFLSASRMIATVQDLYNREPHLTARILGYWSNAFSAAVNITLVTNKIKSNIPLSGRLVPACVPSSVHMSLSSSSPRASTSPNAVQLRQRHVSTCPAGHSKLKLTLKVKEVQSLTAVYCSLFWKQ
jgi:hypothetical protein